MPCRRSLALLALALCACGDGEGSDEIRRYTPHVVLDIPAQGDIADPHVLKIDGKWFLYATNSQIDLALWTSTDLKHWKSEGVIWAPTPGTWNANSDWGGAWAPAVHAGADGYYLYYTANTQIGVARAETPYGPFVELYDHPLVGGGHGGVGDGVLGRRGGDLDERAIDAFVYQAPDGGLTLYYTVNEPLSTLYAAPMTSHGVLAGAPGTRLLGPEQPWESVICEGPFVTQHGGRLHLTYSANLAPTPHYAIGGAVGDSPLGPFERYPENPVLSQVPELDFFGPGHHSIVPGYDDDLLAFYHTKSTAYPGYDRRIRYAPIRLVDGHLRIDPPAR